MKANPEITLLAQQAQRHHRCITSTSPRIARALERRGKCGDLIRPYPGLFAEPEGWNGLDPPEQSRWITRALAQRHSSWVFAGLSAAAMFGLPYRHSLHEDRHIYLMTRHDIRSRANSKIRYVHVPAHTATHCSGVPVTRIARTLVDCALIHGFRDTLPMADAALRQGIVTKTEIRRTAYGLRDRNQALRKLIEFANR